MLSRSLKHLAKSSTIKCLSKNKSAMAASAEVFEDNVKSFNEIPSPPESWFFGHAPLFMKKENAEHLDQWAAGLQQQYGYMVRLRLPGGMGNGHMVMLYNAKDIKTMYGLEERIPKLPGNKKVDFARFVFKTLI